MRVPQMNAAVLCLLLACLLFPLGTCADAAPDSQLLILVVNDDGYFAPGLRLLAEALKPLGEVVVAAPMQNQSGTGHSTTTGQFIRVRPIELSPGVRGHAIAARPATCVRLALESLLPRKPDLVVSGINRGTNLGIVTFYSGTVGAARGAALVGIPAVAVSMQGDAVEDYAATAAFVAHLVEELRTQDRVQPGLFLNVNAPAGERRGVHITHQSTTPTPHTFDRYINPREQVYFWSDHQALPDDQEGTDVWAVVRGFISITPLQVDQTWAAGFEWLHRLTEEAAPAPAR